MLDNANGKANGESEGEGNASVFVDEEELLYLKYPVLSAWEFVLLSSSNPNKNDSSDNNNKNPKADDSTVTGMIYCTDEISHTIMVIPHVTTLAELEAAASSSTLTDVRILNARCIVQATPQQPPQDLESNGVAQSLIALPATPLLKKTLDDRERRAIRQAEESFRHINEKVSGKGQEVFDRLLKACGEVVWKDESIIVLNQIQVDPPYGSEDCRILTKKNGQKQQHQQHQQQQKQSSYGGSAQEGLERVRKIVAADSRKG